MAESLQLPEVGKISPQAFDTFVYPHLGAKRLEVLVGPQAGVDIGVTRVASGVVMATTTDPLFVVPAYGWQRAAWFAAHIVASDAATSGLAPHLMTVDLNLPLSMTTKDFEEFWTAFASALQEMEIAVVSGHTARYEGCAYPMVGGATVMSIGPEDRYITAAGARIDDMVLCTKGAAIEATALMAATFPDYFIRQVGVDVQAAADRLFERMTVVPDARIAARVGVRDAGVTAMHDATECGVIGGVFEMAQAANLGIEIDDAAIPILPETAAICQVTGMDPLNAISEGTLLLTVRPQHVDAVLKALRAAQIDAAVIGRMQAKEKGRWRVQNGRKMPLVHPGVDPFWAAFSHVAEKAGGSS
ncbi:MAG: AIR synthase family protein [Firmicutes bacterium]|nr:AIR synthase family protein [Bacillota bacterium]